MKRIAIKLVVFLLLGAVVNVGVAWGCMSSESDRTFDKTSVDKTEYDFLDGDDIVVQPWAAWLEAYVGPAPGEPWLAEYAHEWGNSYVRTCVVRAESALDEHRQRQCAIQVWHYEAGWPLRCMTGSLRYETWWSDSARSGQRYDLRSLLILGQWSITSEAELESLSPVEILDRARVPLGPMPLPFLTNGVLYAAILWLLWSTPFATRRLIRKRRGRCIRCGYDLGHAEHDVCPECGG